MRIRLDQILGGAVLTAGLTLGSTAATAQDGVPLDLDPVSDSAPAPPASSGSTVGTGGSQGAPGATIVTGEGQSAAGGDALGGEAGFYHYDDPRYQREEDSVMHSGPVPELHVVRGAFSRSRRTRVGAA